MCIYNFVNVHLSGFTRCIDRQQSRFCFDFATNAKKIRKMHRSVCVYMHVPEACGHHQAPWRRRQQMAVMKLVLVTSMQNIFTAMRAHFSQDDVKDQNTPKFHQKHHCYATILARQRQNSL